MTDDQKKDKKAEFKRKQDDLLSELGLIETGMTTNLQIDDADIIDCTIKHINILNADLEKCAQYNEVLAVTNKALVEELNNKAKNLLSFHTANILQGLLAYNGTTTRSAEGLIDDSVGLAKAIIERIIKETNKNSKDQN